MKKTSVYPKNQSSELAQILEEVREQRLYAIDFASFAPGIKDTVELTYVANLWAARANLIVTFNFQRKLCVFEMRQQT
jgi:hypothetical protein